MSKIKAAAKRKFKVYPSAYANMYASAVVLASYTRWQKEKKKMREGGMVIEDMTTMIEV